MKSLFPEKLFIIIGGYFGDSFQLEANSGKLIYKRFDRSRNKNKAEMLFNPSPEQWQGFWSVANSVDIWHWKRRYEDNSKIDGTSWRVNIAIDENQLDSSGSNDYPPGDGFRKFRLAVRQLINGEPFH